ncbi:MAG: TPM domain-containing protein [Bacteroidales bacterium]
MGTNIIHIIRNFSKQFLIVLSFLLPIIATSQDIPEKPNPPKLVNDYTNTLSSDEVNSLETKLVSYFDSTSTQIVIVMTDDLLGYDRADYAFKLGEKWGVGQKDKNNGIVILIKPNGKQGERKAFIAVGRGLEPVITDALSKRITENEMIPNFRENKFYAGLDQATTILMQLASGEFPAGYNKNAKSKPKAFAFLVPIFIIIIVLLMIKKGGSNTMGGGKNTSFWTTLFLLSAMNNSGRGSWGGFSGGSSGGGGGFGGFGGGSFGGGGAGGSW